MWFLIRMGVRPGWGLRRRLSVIMGFRYGYGYGYGLGLLCLFGLFASRAFLLGLLLPMAPYVLRYCYAEYLRLLYCNVSS